ncbi:tubulin folding cofactor B [Artemisia annua]|uniref:Tubulin folding cofactor B n=1 Tax=Artemisia annua TaxID=35608 RepID=A0A2U1M7W5_ARTAN|nr:tubulin folding cofactor B [Artemisia annua]
MDEDHMENICANIKVGDRCQVEPGQRGVVKFVGRAEALGAGFWVGIQYDEPLGKHGLVKGTRFFECPPLHGAMVRQDKVKVEAHHDLLKFFLQAHKSFLGGDI